ncbi:hypothetical protein OCJ37_19455 [Xanthomonas sp. AM6]|uniref:hypothetical protein n=1 Tax=Xanthomonas sp. AM6 TaxID=2982531 RepID=UPI0021D8FAD0|nr:hypothetical protein [Xanthomonas sp. AM6]UYB52116.1 hypothetical protein OCJ37_19455 [Xanthomonas sp. AM6]
MSGVGIKSADDIWDKVLNWMGVPNSVSLSKGGGRETSVGISAKAKANILGFGGGEAGAEGGAKASTSSSTVSLSSRAGLAQVEREISNSDYVLLVDDFHYMPRDVQAEAAKALKEAVRLKIKICTAAVLHRGDDILRANPELRGRVSSFDLNYWDLDDLVRIGTEGFNRLNVEIGLPDLKRLATEAAGSPQLMQQICLQACFVLDVRGALESLQAYPLTEAHFSKIFEQVSTTASFRSLVDVLDSGPKTRGIERKMYQFTDDTNGDVYRCVLKAVASDPPGLSFPYQELLERTQKICVVDAPVGSSVIGTCLHMARLAEQKFPNERVLDWDEQTQILDIPDPYLLVYLRWSGRLKEPN